MPAKRVCAKPGCPHFQPCPDGHNAPWAGSNRRAELPKDWPTIRRAILRRDPVCVRCHAAPSTDVDHIGDKHDHSETNLRGLCGPCHASRTGKQGNAARYAR